MSINQGRVGFRDLNGLVDGLATKEVSINQGRVGFRDRVDLQPLHGVMPCPSIRAASASATTPEEATMPTIQVSINQGRVGFRDPKEMHTTGSVTQCPSIRAASASATPARCGVWQ